MAAQKITPCLWFDGEAEEAARFYVSIFRNAKITDISRYGKEGFEVHGRPEGSAMVVAFEIEGQSFTALNGGFFQKQPNAPGQQPSVVIAVDDIQAAMKKVKKAGGEVLGEPMDIPGVGQYVAFFDTERNRVSMLQPLPRH